MKEYHTPLSKTTVSEPPQALRRPSSDAAFRGLTGRGTSPVEIDAVYSTAIPALENRQIMDPLTGETWPALLPKTKELLFAEGNSWANIQRRENTILNNLEDRHPKWTVVKDLPRELYKIAETDRRVNQLLDNRIVAVPGNILNALVCAYLLTRFPQSVLLSVPGFILRKYSDDDGDFYSLRLDVDDWLSKRGFIVPVLQRGLITGLRIYRHPKDERPFLLRSRGGEVPLSA